MRKSLRTLSVIVLLSALVVLLAHAAGDPPGEEAVSPVLPSVHLDVRAVEEGVLEATRAFLREDPAAFRRGLDRVETATRRLDREADEAYGSDLITYEKAFHVTLDRAREFAIRGDLENAFHQFVWVQRACITCHGLAREQGLLPPAGDEEGGAAR